MSKTVWSTIVVILIGLAGLGVVKLAKNAGPQGPDQSVFYATQSRDHIEVGTEHPVYNSNPPSGGWHYILTAKKQFYAEPIPDEYAIHNLEHGDIWITYHPRVSEAVKNELKQFEFAKILISPREANDKDIALVAWEHVDAFNLDGNPVSKERIMDFIKRYRNKGPEKIPAGAMETTFN